MSRERMGTKSLRRERHLTRAAEVLERKRLRRRRREIVEAYDRALFEISARSAMTLTYGVVPYRALDEKNEDGRWIIADSLGDHVAYGASRDKARAKAKEIASEEAARLNAPSKTIEDMMRDQGYERISRRGYAWLTAGPIDKHWSRIS